MKKIKQFTLKKIADDYILIPCHQTAEEMSSILTLSETAAYIYRMLDQCPTIEDLIGQVSKHYNIDAAIISQDVRDTLQQFADIGLITL